MKLVIDGFSKLFTVPLGAKFGKIWKILTDYLTEHNRAIVSAKLYKETSEIPYLVNNTVISEFDATPTTDFTRLEIDSVPKKYAITKLDGIARKLIITIENNVYIPLSKLLEENPENRTDVIRTAILTNSKEQMRIFNEFVSVLFFLSKVEIATELKSEVSKIESIYERVQNSIQHNDMSTLIQLISVDMKKYLEDVQKKLDTLKKTSGI